MSWKVEDSEGGAGGRMVEVRRGPGGLRDRTHHRASIGCGEGVSGRGAGVEEAGWVIGGQGRSEEQAGELPRPEVVRIPAGPYALRFRRWRPGHGPRDSAGPDAYPRL